MRVLAIDPGYDRLGVAVLDKDSGKDILVYSSCIKTDKKMPLPLRLLEIGKKVESLLVEYKPQFVGIENIFFNKNQKTAMAVAQARGMIVYLAKKHGSEVREFGPQEIKVAVTGYGKSDKTAVIAMLRRLLKNLPDKALDDEYDAIAVGLTCLNSRI